MFLHLIYLHDFLSHEFIKSILLSFCNAEVKKFCHSYFFLNYSCINVKCIKATELQYCLKVEMPLLQLSCE